MITDICHAHLCRFMMISPRILLRMRNVSDKICKENQNTHFIFNNFFFYSRAIYEKMWKIIVEPDMPQLTVLYGACALHADT
jgi:hypothetical protein